MSFSSNLKKYRTQKKLTGEALAKQIGVSVNSYRNYEQGKTKPAKEEVYEKLADVFEITVEELKGAESDKAPAKGRKTKRPINTRKSPKATAPEMTIDDKIARATRELEALKQQKQEEERQALFEEYEDILDLIAELGLTKTQVKKAIMNAAAARKKAGKKRSTGRKKAAAKEPVIKKSVVRVPEEFDEKLSIKIEDETSDGTESPDR